MITSLAPAAPFFIALHRTKPMHLHTEKTNHLPPAHHPLCANVGPEKVTKTFPADLYAPPQLQLQ